MALFEGQFSLDWILEMSGLKVTEVLQVVENLIDTGILQKMGPGLFRFTDESRRRRLAQALPGNDRDLWHRSIADIFLRENRDDREAVLAAASHLLHLSNDEQGCGRLLQAGDLYRKTHKHQRALQCYQKIIDDLEGSDTDGGYEIFTSAVIAVSKIVELVPDVEATIPPLKTAIRKSRKRGDDSRTAFLEMHLAKNQWFCSNFKQALRHFNRG